MLLCCLGTLCVCVWVPSLQVTPVEASILCGMYLVYVCATFYTSRADEPLHADLALHEFPPQDGGIGKQGACKVVVGACGHVGCVSFSLSGFRTHVLAGANIL